MRKHETKRSAVTADFDPFLHASPRFSAAAVEAAAAAAAAAIKVRNGFSTAIRVAQTH